MLHLKSGKLATSDAHSVFSSTRTPKQPIGAVISPASFASAPTTMILEQLPPALASLCATSKISPVQIGMSAADVYKVESADTCRYLKVISRVYDGTTFDLQREQKMMQWLAHKLPVPQVLAYHEAADKNYLLMSAVPGQAADTYTEQHSPYALVERMVEGLQTLWSVPVDDCPYLNDRASRLTELEHLMRSGLADIDIENWQENTGYSDPDELLLHLQTTQFDEELVLSHGDFGDSNFFVDGHKISGWIDLGRCGLADKWYDIAFCVRALQDDFDDPVYLDYFFQKLGVEPNWEKINYFILLDEMF